ncbi:alpha/beta fold hydrolase [Kineococcus rhizosphaerae]|uniref:Pimeloyl-ACP methyl ester carboxylesterase n=1 Tax=Kineococcus rhizosphaerae TaxID=559628 RepID=A0A2T0QSB8_9ACTN|nr:alpha/beta hydrolase [Kineococcus rhizosphaerae]PRY07805.1 pimeloyl-ACP methyl ester carboxylesterase [Kineococcus rhizosphaerae]
MSILTHHFADVGDVGDVGDVTLHYVTAGEGDPVILIHGFPQTWYSWIDVIPLLVAQGYRCVVPDLRGLGDSTRPPSGYDKLTLAGDLRTLMVEHLGLERFAAVGHDWGGAVAFALAAHHPEHVTSLSVLDVAIPGDGQAHLGQGGKRWHHTFLQTPDLPEALIVGREEVFVRWFYENYGHHQRVIAESAVQEYLRTYTTPGAMRTGFALYRNIGQDIADNQDLTPLTIPVLGVGGGTSWGRGEEVATSLRRMARDVTGVVLEDCGHWIPDEKPAELASLLTHFLARSREAAPASMPSGALE